MAKKSKGQKETEVKKAGVSKKRRREVQVVSCPSDFPISQKNKNNMPQSQQKSSSQQQNEPQLQQKGGKTKLLDWSETAKEIRHLGATAFEGQQRRKHLDEQYEFLTGRKRKKQHVPLPIARGIKKKAEQRLARQIQEAKEAGVVLPKSLTKKKEKEVDNTPRVYGPAPSVGFMKKGVLRVKPS